MFGWTATVCWHCAVSEAEAAPLSAYEPLCTGVLTTDPFEQLQPLSEPVSKPGLASRFTGAAEASAKEVVTAVPPQMSAAASASAPLRRRRVVRGATGRPGVTLESMGGGPPE